MNPFQSLKERKVLDKDGKVDALGPYGKQKLTGNEISAYFRKNKVKDPEVRKAVEVALDLGGAYSVAQKEIKKFFGNKIFKSKEVQKALKFANESFTYNQAVNQLSEENLVEKNLMPDIQKIVDTKGAAKVGGIMIDMFTASMISQIYNKVNDSNKKKMEKSNISTLVNLAQKMMQKMGDNLEEGGKSAAQQAAIAISKKEKAGKPGYDKEGKSLKNESVMDAYRQMWEDGEKYAPQLDEKKEFKQSDIDTVAKLTDRNEHTKSLMHIAKVMGERKHLKKLELIYKMHNEYGHMPSGLKSLRDEIYDDLKKEMKKYSNGDDMYGAT